MKTEPKCPKMSAIMRRWYEIFTKEGLPHHVAVYRAAERDSGLNAFQYQRFLDYVREYRKAAGV